MMIDRPLLSAFALVSITLLGACSKGGGEESAAAAASASATPSAAPSAAAPAAAPAVAGFDPAAAPQGQNPPGAWPYFSLMDGYTRMTPENSPSYESKKWLEDVKYERFEFFDGKKLIPVEGRAYVTRGLGTAASWFQIQKTYEALVKGLGGVTVFEGSGEVMENLKLKFADQRYRGEHLLQYDKMGVYMVRTPDRQIWVEVYQPWDDSKGYWLTVMETKPLEMTARLLAAEEMKAALDKDGHVALYINFDTDKTAMKPDSAATVGEIVKLLTTNPGLKLEVQGHTDNAGTPAHNLTLSEGRASAVVGALMAQGIAMNRLTPKGYGQTKPIANNASEDGRAKNRRVELVKK
ncbi:OmpA family protein [Novosphingobium sp. JCM 18896]|uniref:OmpA family protein n=1 Tax=Novosphingobium sp. JCM 18896 TaxID=2989731 RepID=UPI0022228F4F|nr:OmpA family protein [Novosphingobium sp. JCM 18896]MCW1431809.1 OmpA family protein [Novosphingobium sp. JCM 18896]